MVIEGKRGSMGERDSNRKRREVQGEIEREVEREKKDQNFGPKKECGIALGKTKVKISTG